MPARKMIPGAYATKIAKAMLPIIYQEFGFSRSNTDWLYDIPCEINLGDFKLPTRPVVYYYIRQDDKYFYVCYCFYHWKDYTHCPPGKLVGGEHRHDFEGAIIRVPRFNPDGRIPGYVEIITICHKEFKRGRSLYPHVIWIEFGGHGIHPGTYFGSKTVMQIRDYVRLINMDKYKTNDWYTVQAAFNKHGAHMPWQWSDNGKNEGLWWTDPAKLFNIYFNRGECHA